VSTVNNVSYTAELDSWRS